MCLAWDATCVNTFAESHFLSAAVSPGSAAREAEDRKRKKYSGLAQRFHFEPLAFETTGVCGPSTKLFVRELGARIASISGDHRETAWLWQRLALAIVRGNAASFLHTTDFSDPSPKPPTGMAGKEAESGVASEDAKAQNCSPLVSVPVARSLPRWRSEPRLDCESDTPSPQQMSIAVRRDDGKCSEAGGSSFEIIQHVCPPQLPGKLGEGSQALPQGRNPSNGSAGEGGQTP